MVVGSNPGGRGFESSRSPNAIFVTFLPQSECTNHNCFRYAICTTTHQELLVMNPKELIVPGLESHIGG